MFSEGFYKAGRRIHLARLTSYVGSAFTEFAIPLFLLEHSGNPVHVGIQWALIALMRLAAGYWAPRLKWFSSDREALVSLDLCMAMSTLLPIGFYGANPVVGCYLATLVVAFLSTVQGGFIDSLVGDTARHETNPEGARAWLIGKIENGRHLGMLLGYGAAYLVSSRLGFRMAFYIDALSFLFSAWLLSTVGFKGMFAPAAPVSASYTILLRPRLRLLTASQLLAGFGLFLYNALHVVVMKRDLGSGDGGLSLLYICQYVGYFFGSRVPSAWVERTGRPLSDRSTVVFRLSVVLVYLAFAFSGKPWMFIATNTVFSFVIGASFPGGVSLFQRAVAPAELRAAGAARLAFTAFSGVLGAALASFLLTRVPASQIFLGGALVFLVAGMMLANYCRAPARAGC